MYRIRTRKYPRDRRVRTFWRNGREEDASPAESALQLRMARERDDSPWCPTKRRKVEGKRWKPRVSLPLGPADVPLFLRSSSTRRTESDARMRARVREKEREREREREEPYGEHAADNLDGHQQAAGSDRLGGPSRLIGQPIARFFVAVLARCYCRRNRSRFSRRSSAVYRSRAQKPDARSRTFYHAPSAILSLPPVSARSWRVSP